MVADTLREQVRFLGSILGQVIREQGGLEIFALEEETRKTARELRKNYTYDLWKKLIEITSNLEIDRAKGVLRAFTVYFHIVNLAEQEELTRNYRRKIQELGSEPYPESIASGINALAKAGLNSCRVQELLNKLNATPVFTAHPTEAKRRTVLDLLLRLQTALQALSQPQVLPDEAEALSDRILSEITLLWQSDEVREIKPTVIDEVTNGLFYFEEVLFDLIPEIYQQLEKTVEKKYPNGNITLPTLLEFGSWVGGDRDGNDFVTPEITEQTLRLHKLTALKHYVKEVTKLRAYLSPSVKQVPVSTQLLQSIENDILQYPDGALFFTAHNVNEPYRKKLSFILYRLKQTLDRSEAAVGLVELKSPAYRGADEFLADLEIIKQSLQQNRGDRISTVFVDKLIRKINVFSFYTSRLDIRQHSARHLSAISEILESSGVIKSPLSRSAGTDQEKALTEEILSSRPLIPGEHNYSSETESTIELFRVIRKSHKILGPKVID